MYGDWWSRSATASECYCKDCHWNFIINHLVPLRTHTKALARVMANWLTLHHLTLTSPFQVRLGVTRGFRAKNRTLQKNRRGKSFSFVRGREEMLYMALTSWTFRAVVFLAGALNLVSQICWDAYYEVSFITWFHNLIHRTINKKRKDFIIFFLK